MKHRISGSLKALPIIAVMLGASPALSAIQNITLNSNGTFSGAAFDPNSPSVIVTHGWQPTAALPLGSSFPLGPLRTAVSDRANAESQSLNLITFAWDGAHTPGLTILDYIAAASRISGAGATLGNSLNTLFNSTSYTGEVHFMGHSLGTAVNAQAASLFPTLNIDQMTIIEAPNTATFYNFSSEWYNAVIPGTQVKYVDNFFGDSAAGPGLGAVGGAILNAAPSGGLQVPGNHNAVVTTSYPSIVAGPDWVTPIFGESDPAFADRPAPEAWDPTPLDVIASATVPLNDFASWTVNAGNVDIVTLSDAMIFNTFSPVGVSHHFDVDADATLLSFDYGFTDPGTGGILQLYFGPTLIWEMPWVNELEGQKLKAVIPIAWLFDAALSSFDISFQAGSYTGDATLRAGTSVYVGNFEVLGAFAEETIHTGVPEPMTLSLLGAGLFGLGWARRKRA